MEKLCESESTKLSAHIKKDEYRKMAVIEQAGLENVGRVKVKTVIL